MSVSGAGTISRTGADYQQYQKSGEDILFRSYSYKNGKGEEKVYYAKDCVKLSLDSYTIPIGSDNYEDVKNMLRMQSSGKIASMGNGMFHETSEVMQDYYSGKLSGEEVKNIFKEYFYHAMGTTLDEREANGVQEASQSNNYAKQFATTYLAGLYEYFSRANTRNACARNMEEGKQLLESNGMNWKGNYYYNADWYYACEEMQELFRKTADELAEEYGAEHVDFKYVEQNTKFTLDGGLNYNDVWDFCEWQINPHRTVGGSFLDVNMAPPKGFVYCCTAYWDGNSGLDGIRDEITKKRAGADSMMFLMAAVKNIDVGTSLLLEQKNYHNLSDWKEDSNYKDAIAFLKKFNINWNFRRNRMEFLCMGNKADPENYFS